MKKLFTIDKHNSMGGFASGKEGIKLKKYDVKICPTILAGYAQRFGNDNCPAIIEIYRLEKNEKEIIRNNTF